MAEALIMCDPAQASKVFALAQCVVVRCEFIFIDKVFEYHVLSPLFDEIDEGLRAPEYHFNLTILNGKIKNVKALRVG